MTLEIYKLRLSAKTGLLGNVFPKLRAVCVESSENIISVIFYCDGPISDEENELCESTMDTIHSDFILSGGDINNPMQINYKIAEIEYPNKMPLIGYWVYYRNENSENYV